MAGRIELVFDTFAYISYTLCCKSIRVFSKVRTLPLKLYILSLAVFGRPFAKRFAVRAIAPLLVVSVMSICNVGIPWPNG